MKILRNILLCSAVAALAVGCGDDGSDDHDHEHQDAGADAGDTDAAVTEATLAWVTPPPTTVVMDQALEGTFSVTTEGTIHVTEIRACEGQVENCGLGGQDTYDLTAPATADGDNYTGSLTIDTVGTWTVVGFAHVDENPHVTEAVEVAVTTPI